MVSEKNVSLFGETHYCKDIEDVCVGQISNIERVASLLFKFVSSDLVNPTDGFGCVCRM